MRCVRCFLTVNKTIFYMKTNVTRSLVVVAIFAFAAASLSSCNRGYGCPTNFSAEAVTNTTTVTTSC